jgi:hypothetical protein
VSAVVDETYYRLHDRGADRVANVPTWRWGLEDINTSAMRCRMRAPGSRGGRALGADIVLIGERYVLYYTAHGADGRLASASRRRRGWTNLSLRPTRRGLSGERSSGLSDPSVTVTDGDVVLLYKNLGAQQIDGQSLTTDGLRTDGAVTTLLNPDALWQAGLVENPTLVRLGGTWFLAYSARDGEPRLRNRLGSATARSGRVARWRRRPSPVCPTGWADRADDGSSNPIVVHADARGRPTPAAIAMYTGRLTLTAYGPTVGSRACRSVPP